MLRGAVQENRQLAVFTPFGENVLLLNSFDGQEGLSELFSFQLHLLSAESQLDAAQILGRNVTFSIAHQDAPPRYFNGYVRSFAQVDMSDRAAVYQAEVGPWLWFLTQTSDCRIFQEQTTPEIIQLIFDNLGFDDYDTGLLTAEYKPREYCVQYRETDFDFVSRLMEEEGIYYYFQHENGKHTLVLADSTTGYFRIEEDKVALAKRSERGIISKDLIHWRHGKRASTSQWASTDYNFKKPGRDLESRSPSIIPALGRLHLERFDYPGCFQQKAAGQERVQVKMQEEEARHEWVSAEGARGTFTPGGVFEVAEHPNSNQLGRRYAIRQIQYRAGRVGGYTSGEVVEEPWNTRFDALPVEFVYRPPRDTSRPIVDGPQTAVVVGPRGEEIYTDEHGRIKVQFHWDREGSRDEKSSCWIRVSQTHAAAGWGAMDIPRVGEEVMVSFLEGDPDRPVVTGRVYNGSARVPFGLPGAMTRSGGKTNTHKGNGNNEMSMDDTAGQEQLRTNAQYNMDTSVGHSQTLVVGVDRTGSIGNNDTLKVGVDSATKIGNDRTEKVANNENVIAGSNIVLQAGTAITLKCGASTIHMNQAGVITISGQYVSSLAAVTNSIVAPMTEIAGSTMLNQAGLICLDVAGIKHIRGGETSVSAAQVEVKGSGVTVIKGAPIKIGGAGAPIAQIPAPNAPSSSAPTKGPSGPAGTSSASGDAGGGGVAGDLSTSSGGGNTEAGKTPSSDLDSGAKPVAADDQKRSGEGATDGSDDVAKGPEAAPSIKDLSNSEGELAPENFETPSERSDAYRKQQQLNENTGGKFGETKFAQMAADVSDDLDGRAARWFLYSDQTEGFLNEGNRQLYDFNDRIFNKQRENPNNLFDPMQYVPGAEGEPQQEIKSAMEWDLRMVQAEQRNLSSILANELDETNRNKVIGELNNSLSVGSNYVDSMVRYVGGRIFSYESHAVAGASRALGQGTEKGYTQIDFSKEEHRIAIGYAEAFLAHGYTPQQYLDFMKTGDLPNK